MSNKKNNQFNKSSGNSAVTGGPGRNSPMAMASMMDKPKDFKTTLKRLLKYFHPHLPTLILVCVIAVISTLFSVLAPKIMSIAINSIEQTVESRINGIIVSINYSLIYKILGVLLGVYVISTILLIIEQYLMANVSQNIVRDMRSEVQRKLTHLPLSFFDRVTHGEILSRAVGDVENIAVTLQENIVQLISGVVTLVGVFIMMLFISRILTLVVLLTIPMYFFIAKPIIKRAQKLFKRRQKANGELNGLIEEMYGGLKTVKAYGKENETKERFTDINNVYCNSGWKAQFITGTIMPLMSFLSNFSYVLICVSSGLLFAMNVITLGDVAAFLIYVKLFSGPVNQITSITNSIQSSIASAERIFEILDETEETDSENNSPEFENGDVIFKDISFRYISEKPLIENLSLNVKNGQTIAIVGPTGAGKTTLVNLLMRFYDLNEGEIRVGGVNASECKRSDIREQFGMVLQDTWLFNGTIMENIRYGKEGASDEECIEAAKKAQAHHFISTLPDGYNTILNEEASNISQGEKQLITIARTLLHDPRILILDEATSNVDTLTEQRIQNGMNEIVKNRTCFIIAHRLSTIKNANKILVMCDGNIVETGTHDSLLEQNGAYAELYKAQFSLLC
ncbi:ABC transporter ATP-binding protein [Haloimpatiens sp. FM7330]|uniref:ABC transporter ATP-binding protein n=1 Tax=Haloimpatiens sp. FM7330 TaxID=3298610 RepID=UPI0036422B1C